MVTFHTTIQLHYLFIFEIFCSVLHKYFDFSDPKFVNYNQILDLKNQLFRRREYDFKEKPGFYVNGKVISSVF